MNIQTRKELLIRLGMDLTNQDEEWQAVKQKAFNQNHWFIPEFIDLALNNIAKNYLQPYQIQELIHRYQIRPENPDPKKVGLVMAGNIPLVGFHDLLCIFLSGHIAMVKASTKDEVLVKHVLKKMTEWDQEVDSLITISEMIRHCDAYIATGSNNSARYFEYYFKKYPSIIRRNRTSVAVLTGKETEEELERLSDDVYQYFGLGCRNVTKIFVPVNYDFRPLLRAFDKWNYLINHHKYKNNYDYSLAIQILNNHYYMTNGSILLVEDSNPFSRISQLHYEFYTNEEEARSSLKKNANIQCLVGEHETAFGKAQTPDICEYADGVDTMAFLTGLD